MCVTRKNICRIQHATSITNNNQTEFFLKNKTRVSRFQTDLTTVNSGRIFYITHKQGREKKFHHFPQQQECSLASRRQFYMIT